MPNTEQLLYQTEIFKDTYSEEHLRTAASELTLWNDCLEIYFWIAFKTVLTH